MAVFHIPWLKEIEYNALKEMDLGFATTGAALYLRALDPADYL
jgi:hypothetical protein